jgi:AraC-like DNA-binding protein
LHIIVIAESLLFALQLLTFRNINSKSNKILGVLMLFLALFLVSSIFIRLGLFDIAIYTNYLVMPLFLAINPFYFLYVKSLTQPNYKFSKKSLIHFIPSFAVLAFNFIFYSLLPEELKLIFITKGIKTIASESIILQLNIFIDFLAFGIYYIQLALYVILMLVQLNKHTQKIKNYFSYEQNISLNWLKIFVLIVIINAVLEVFIIVYSIYLPLPRPFVLVYYLILMLLVTFLGYFGLKQTDIYIGNIKTSNVILNDSKEIIKAVEDEKIETSDDDSEISTLHSLIPPEEQKRIVDAVISLMETEKIYLNNNLSVYDIAHELKTNKSYISFSINNILKKNFRNFVNEYRIKEAQKLLLDPKFDNLSIEGIAQTVGYISKSTFNTSFQKYTGKKPSDFRNEGKSRI